MATLHLMIGAPGIGKTHYCSKHMGEFDVRVSMDDLQQMIGGGQYSNYRSDLKPVYQNAEMNIIKDALGRGFDVWLDRTNMDRKRRTRYIVDVRNAISLVRIEAINFMAFDRPNDDWLLYRRMQDSRGGIRRQWAQIIDDMLKNYEPPTLEEGFAEIVNVKLEEVTE